MDSKKISERSIKIEKYVGTVFGKLTVLNEDCMYDKDGNRTRGVSMFNCLCECGVHIACRASSLIKGVTKSCGCLRRYNHPNKKHGLSSTLGYWVFQNMKSRCYCKKTTPYKYYGAKGIKVCDRWLDKENGFKNFLNDMGERPSKNHSIDRINVNGDYEPSNCRWASRIEQANNKTTNNFQTYGNDTHTVTEWSRILNVPVYLIKNKLKKKSFSDIITELKDKMI